VRIKKNRPEIRFSAACVVGIFLGVPLGCAADDQFSAETSDEYTEPLKNALIGTPSSTISIPLSGPAVEVLSVGKAGAAGTGGSTGGAAGGPGSGGSSGVGPADGGSPDDGSSTGFGFWHFDDCSPKSHFLRDSSGLGANAQQALQASCVPGISGLGVQLRSAKDIVQVPDEPQFSVGQHVGVAAWVNPKTVSGDQPIVIKRLNNKTAFSLGVHNGNIEMSVVLSTGKTVISRAPIAANQWTHVAGMYDGTFVFLFINGQQFGQIFAAGSVRDVFAPIRIGATTGSQFFNGIIDEVFLTTDVISSSTLTNLACISRPSTFSVSPATSGPVPAETNVHYDIAVTNNDVGACSAKGYDLFLGRPDSGISANVDVPQFQQALPGALVHFGVEVTGSDSADPGVHAVPFFIDAFGGSNNNFEQLTGQLTYELSAPTGCFVTTRKELMITNPSVVDDPIRTAGSVDPSGGFGGAGGSAGAGDIGEAGAPGDFGVVGGALKAVPSVGGSSGGATAPAAAQTAGVWSFGYLMRQMAPTPEAAPAMTLQLLKHWLTNQTVNGFIVPARPAMQQRLIDIWPKTPNGELDLDRSPLTLQAIVNRIDTRNLAEGSAGEGRFVFGVNGAFNFQNFSLIVEYNLVAQTEQDVSDWANRWHALGSLPFPSEEYNTALEGVTRRFTDRNASPDSVNGSALVELRSNEIALSARGEWELRSFVLSKETGLFDETTVKETPDLSFNNTPAFARFVNQNADAIIAEVPGGNSHTVPLQFEGSPFMGGSVINNQVQWNAPGINNPDARFHASMNTCNGCHGPETGTFGFLMVLPRSPGGEATLSPFLTGTTVIDRFTRQTRTLNDLARRRVDLTALVCSTASLPIAKQ
jgi:Concanavalin A-like lectin/glucanases superfamily